LKTASLSQWTKRPKEVPGGKVLPAGDERESFEQRPITALTRPYSDSTLITDQCPQRANGVSSTTHDDRAQECRGHCSARRRGAPMSFPALLRQPHGFEGLIAIVVVVDANSLAVAQLLNKRVLPIDDDAAAPSLGGHVKDDDDAVTRVDELFRLHGELRPSAPPVRKPAPDSRMASVVGAVHDVVVVDLDLGVRPVPRRFPRGNEVLKAAADLVHVLLRNTRSPSRKLRVSSVVGDDRTVVMILSCDTTYSLTPRSGRARVISVAESIGRAGSETTGDWLRTNESPAKSQETALETEGEGFEPSSEENPLKRFSRPPHSTALPPLPGSGQG
jgi:hypothetical protein